MTNNKIIFIHVLNGFTGSPNVLATVINALFKENCDITLVTSFNNSGFLSDVKCSRKINISYIFKKNRFLRLIQFLKFQFYSGAYVLMCSKNDIIYINTILPFFPAIVAKLKGNRVIYHFHESYPNMSLFTSFLYKVVELTSNSIICVSEYVFNQLNNRCQRKGVVIYNSLSPDYFDKKIAINKINSRKTVLMVSSAREYKGVFIFCKLAMLLEHYDFILVCDATHQENLDFFRDYTSIRNLNILETQKDLHQFYAKSDLIVNFSIPSLFIETFGLTILEGLSYGIPCIVPPVGGITEFVYDGLNGYKVDCRDTPALIDKIRLILEDEVKYKEMSNEALRIATKFSFKLFIKRIKLLLH